jgi:hypothetical protein
MRTQRKRVVYQISKVFGALPPTRLDRRVLVIIALLLLLRLFVFLRDLSKVTVV